MKVFAQQHPRNPLAAFLWLLLIHQVLTLTPAWSQVLETFADSNLTTHPTWYGDTSRYRVVVPDLHLQLQAPAVTGQAWLGTESRAVHNGRWEMRFQLRFNPSSSNQLDWYLMATDSHPHLSGKSYVLRIGGIDDNLTFYFKSGNSLVRIGSLAPSWLNRDVNPMAIRIERYLNGIWYFWADSSQTATTVPRWTWLGDLRDSTLKTSRFTGFQSQYTSTRSTLFSWFYYLVQGQPVPDSLRPAILSWDIDQHQTVQLLWSESMDTSALNGAILTWVEKSQPAGPIRWIGDTMMTLGLGSDFPYEHPQTLRVQGLRDQAGNVCDTDLTVYRPLLQHGRLVLTEIMSDPEPPVWPPPWGLPAEEYIEIYNPGPVPVQLKGYRLRDLTTTTFLPPYLLNKGKTLVLVSRSSEETWHAWYRLQGSLDTPRILGCDPWPNLNNDGDRLSLETPDGLVLDTVRYNLNYWKTLQQKQGGWALTKANPRCPCADSLNWIPSPQPRGGDPLGPLDTTHWDCSPGGTQAWVDTQVDPNGRLILRFGTAVHGHQGTRVSVGLNGLTNELTLSTAIGQISQTDWVLPLPVHLMPEPGKTIHVQTKGWLACNGDTIPDQEMQTGIGIPAISGDVIITEIYPRPKQDTWPWIEVCNRSNQVLDPSRTWIVRTNLNGEAMDGNPVGQPLDAWLPGMCYVLTRNPDMLRIEGLHTCDWAVKVPTLFRFNLPPLPSGGGFVELQNPNGLRLDRIAYHDSSFHPLVENPQGLSLERPWNTSPYTQGNHPKTAWWTTSKTLRAGPGCYPNRSSDTSQWGSTMFVGRMPSLYKLTTSTNAFEPSIDQRLRIGLQGPAKALVSIDVTDWTGKSLESICQNTLADSLSSWYWDGGRTSDANQSGIRGYLERHRILRLYWEEASGQRGWDLLEIYKRNP